MQAMQPPSSISLATNTQTHQPELGWRHSPLRLPSLGLDVPERNALMGYCNTGVQHYEMLMRLL